MLYFDDGETIVAPAPGRVTHIGVNKLKDKIVVKPENNDNPEKSDSPQELTYSGEVIIQSADGRYRIRVMSSEPPKILVERRDQVCKEDLVMLVRKGGGVVECEFTSADKKSQTRCDKGDP